MRTAVGPVAGTNRASPWHAISYGSMEQQAIYFAYYMQRTSLEICICCNFNLPTVDAQDSGKEHRRDTATWATSLHFGNSSGNM